MSIKRRTFTTAALAVALAPALGAANPRFAYNSDVQIAWRELGDGPPLVLLHGFTDSGASWGEYGYVEALRSSGRRLIMVDLRGHGASGRPADPAAYDDGLRAGDVAAVLDQLGLERADLMGYSMGGWVALNFARLFPKRIDRLIVGGAHAFGQSMNFYREALSGGLSYWLALVERLGGPMPEASRARILAGDLAALRAAVAADRPDISETLRGFERPVLVYAGGKDQIAPQVARMASLVANGAFAEIPECNHIAALRRVDLVAPHVRAFLSRT